MKLMVSFIFRYITVLIKDKVVTDHYDFTKLQEIFDANYDNLLKNQDVMRKYCDEYQTASDTMVCIDLP